VHTKFWLRHTRGRYIKGTQRRGAVLALVPFLVLASAGVAILMVDLGHITATRSRAQSAADAAAIAGCLKLRQGYMDDKEPNRVQISKLAIEFADLNHPDFANSLVQTDIILGDWDEYARTFTADANYITAVKVIVHCDTEVLFSSIFGGTGKHVMAASVAGVTVYEDSEEPFLDEISMPYLCNEKYIPLGEHEHAKGSGGGGGGGGP
jgi:Flp pilus assembly protein TadG